MQRCSATVCCGAGRTSAWGATANLLIAAAGAGVLAYPFATQAQGVVLNVVATATCAAINAFTLSIVAVAAHEAHWGGAGALGSATYEATIGAWLGRVWRRVAAGSVLLGSLGALTGFLVIMCDLVQPIVLVAAGDFDGRLGSASPGCNAALAFFAQRWVVAAVFGILMLPLTAARRLSSLSHSSLLAAASVAVVTLVLALQAGRLAPRGPPAGRRLGASDQGPWLPGQGDGWSVLSTLPIIVFALGNHLQLVPLWRDMVAPEEALGGEDKRPASALRNAEDGASDAGQALAGRRDGLSSEGASGDCAARGAVSGLDGFDAGPAGHARRLSPADVQAAEAGARGLTVAMLGAAALCTLLYCSTGLVGLLAFGSKVCGDVLRSMGSPGNPAVGCEHGSASDGVAPVQPGEWAAWNMAAKGLMAIHIALAFPVIHFPCRETLLEAAAWATRAWARRPVPAGGAGDSSIGGAAEGRGTHGLRARLVVAVLLTGVCAVLAVGAPGVQVVFGLCGATVSVTQIYLLPAAILWRWAAMQGGSHGEGLAEGSALLARGGSAEPTEAGLAKPRMARLWACGGSPAVLRAQAVSLWVIGTALGVLGTAVTVWQTWLS